MWTEENARRWCHRGCAALACVAKRGSKLDVSRISASEMAACAHM